MVAVPAQASRSLSALICRSIPALQRQLPSQTRLASLDITATHISVAISDRERSTAYPFGVLARTALPLADARILSSALQRANTHDERGTLDISGLIIGIPPGSAETPQVAVDLLNAPLSDTQGNVLFPGLAAVLFYSEAHVLKRAVDAQRDYVRSVELLPPKLESRKMKRFAAAMNPKVPADQLLDDAKSRARLSASELLQAVLDDLNRLPQ